MVTAESPSNTRRPARTGIVDRTLTRTRVPRTAAMSPPSLIRSTCSPVYAG